MPEYVKKSAPIFLSTHDEDGFASRLRALVPEILFIDGQRWPSAIPPTYRSISQCCSKLVYIWNPTVRPNLPFKPLPNGTFQGPSSGAVVQFARSRQDGNLLLSGQIGVGFDKNDPLMVQTVDRIWNTLRALNAASLASIDPLSRETIKKGIKNYIVGSHAKELSEKGILLKHSDVEVYYRAE